MTGVWARVRRTEPRTLAEQAWQFYPKQSWLAPPPLVQHACTHTHTHAHTHAHPGPASLQGNRSLPKEAQGSHYITRPVG